MNVKAAQALSVAIAGQPNTGKSTIFNLLTGLNQEVGNWAGKTVEIKKGKSYSKHGSYIVIDLPGTYSMSASSEEERIASDFIQTEHPDLTVIVASAVSPERTLYYAIDIMLLGCPALVVLNMADVAQKNSVSIDVKHLSESLGVPVLLMSAAHKKGARELIEEVNRNLIHPVQPRHICHELAELLPEPAFKEYSALVQAIINSYASDIGLEHAETLAWKVMEGDSKSKAKVNNLIQGEGDDHIEGKLSSQYQAATHQARYAWLEKAVGADSPGHHLSTARNTYTAAWDRWLLHPVMGGLIMLFILLLAVTAGFFLGFPLALLTGIFWKAVGAPFLALIPDTLVIIKALVTGTWKGMGAVMSMLPFIMVFYAVFAILEDVGYMARAAFLMDRFMGRIGLSGKSFIPLLFSVPCNITGVMGSRIIENPRQRLLTILLVPLVPCAAKLIVLTTLASWLFTPAMALLTVLALTTLNIMALVACSLLFGRFLPQSEDEHGLLMELPHYHCPNVRNIIRHISRNTMAFLKKASTLIVCFTIIIWFVSYYPTGNIDTSLLGRFGVFITPVGAAMGADWRLITSLLASMVSKEAVLATMGVIYNAPVTELPHVLKAAVTPASAIAFMCAQSLFIPCIATLGMLYNETKSIRMLGVILSYTIILPFIIASIVYQTLSIFIL